MAVRFLLVDQLEKVIIERLWCDTPPMNGETILDADEENVVACHLSLLCGYTTLWDANEVKLTADVLSTPLRRVPSIEVIYCHLLQIMVFIELSVATLFNFSREAFHFYLSKTQRTSNEQTWDWSLEEYLKLREISTWCVVRAAATEAAIDLDRECLPGPEIALRFLREGLKSDPVNSRRIFRFSKGRESFVENILREDLNEFLWMVDLVSSHPELLVTIIEPLNLIGPLDLSRIYCVQAMRGSMELRKNAIHQATDVWHWAGSGLYLVRTRFSSNLTLIISVEPSDADRFSMVSAGELKMEFSRRTFEWEIVLNPPGHLVRGFADLLEIRFYRLRLGESLSMKIRQQLEKPNEKNIVQT